VSELASKKEQLSALRIEVQQLERNALIGQCYRKSTSGDRYRSEYCYLQITGLEAHSSINVKCVFIKEATSPNISIEYRGAVSINKIHSDYSRIDENVFIDKVQKLLHRVPLLKQVQNRKCEEQSSE